MSSSVSFSMRRRLNSSSNNSSLQHNNTNNNSLSSAAAANQNHHHQQHHHHHNHHPKTRMSSRKDDPVFNVRFVQLVENHPCLWNSTLPAYSKKEEIQKAWQDVANETKDSVRNCRERWRTIRSSFLRSLKMSRTSTGRGKRKYYLSKYLQFLIPYTKTRLKNSGGGAGSASGAGASSIIALRKSEAIAEACTMIPPMTRINHMPLATVSSDDTKDSAASEVAFTEEEVLVSLQEQQQQQQQHQQEQQQQLRLQPTIIKVENDANASPVASSSATTSNNNNANAAANNSTSSTGNNPIKSDVTNATAAAAAEHNRRCAAAAEATMRSLSAAAAVAAASGNFLADARNSATQQQQQQQPFMDMNDYAEWIKCKNEIQRHCMLPTNASPAHTAVSMAPHATPPPLQQHQTVNANHAQPHATPDADQSFLNSLHPFLREMNGKQNRRFRQKVVALIDAILDNADA